jgi:hypothetical protein
MMKGKLLYKMVSNCNPLAPSKRPKKEKEKARKKTERVIDSTNQQIARLGKPEPSLKMVQNASPFDLRDADPYTFPKTKSKKKNRDRKKRNEDGKRETSDICADASLDRIFQQIFTMIVDGFQIN